MAVSNTGSTSCTSRKSLFRHHKHAIDTVPFYRILLSAQHNRIFRQMLLLLRACARALWQFVETGLFSDSNAHSGFVFSCSHRNQISALVCIRVHEKLYKSDTSMKLRHQFILWSLRIQLNNEGKIHKDFQIKSNRIFARNSNTELMIIFLYNNKKLCFYHDFFGAFMWLRKHL